MNIQYSLHEYSINFGHIELRKQFSNIISYTRIITLLRITMVELLYNTANMHDEASPKKIIFNGKDKKRNNDNEYL